MPKTLYAKLSVVLVILLAAIGLTYALLTMSATKHYFQEVNQRLNRDLAFNLVADRKLVQNGQINESALEETFHYYMTINPSIEIYLLAPDGTILSYSADPDKVKRQRVSLEPIRTFLENSRVFPLLGDDPRNHDRRKAFSVTPVPSYQDLQGYLYVILRGEEFDTVDAAIQESYFLRLSGWALSGSLVIGLLAGLVVFHIMTRRLRHLAEAMDNFRKSDFTDQVPFSERHISSSADEIQRLEITFAEMARHIVAQLDALSTKDTLRRELVAQVSHDLRTPLASLHGYLETLQIKDKALTNQKRSEYLGLALHHSARLARLVDDLFELAKLDAKETPPQVEPFSVAELTQDILLKFQLKAQKKGIELTMMVSESLPFVIAEIRLIERVLENLLENALNHTPKGGLVRIEIHPNKEEVSINVTDSGHGIAASDLPHIFDRFYQAGHRSREDRHAGLGLAIAKRILVLHGSTIHVKSQLAKGSTFTFTLPIWQASR